MATAVSAAKKAAQSLAGLAPAFGSKLQQLLQASGGKIWVVSGHRSTERQRYLWDKKVAELRKRGMSQAAAEKAARKYVAPPGFSNHEKGEAADLGGDLKLAHQLAPRFGLHFRMPHEPWHIERADLKSNPDAYTTPPDNHGHESEMEAGTDLHKIETQMANLANIIGVGSEDEMFQRVAQAEKEGAVAPGSTGNLAKFMAAIKQVESGGNYKIKGPQTKYGQATGAYQWLDSTWGKYKGFARAADAPPEVQEERALRDFQGLVQKYGGDMRKVAMHWHGGPNTKLWGPKTQSYADKVLSLMGGA